MEKKIEQITDNAVCVTVSMQITEEQWKALTEWGNRDEMNRDFYEYFFGEWLPIKTNGKYQEIIYDFYTKPGEFWVWFEFACEVEGDEEFIFDVGDNIEKYVSDYLNLVIEQYNDNGSRHN
jgi:hypothetical protein